MLEAHQSECQTSSVPRSESRRVISPPSPESGVGQAGWAAFSESTSPAPGSPLSAGQSCSVAADSQVPGTLPAGCCCGTGPGLELAIIC